ncbi:MAG: leucine-rich repeat protein [Eubacterium sp.]|nr:leucine-rich repeat protein [Eubacterium sp.]
MKKIVSLSLSVILALTAMFSVGFSALADGSGNCGTNGDNVTWTLSGSTLTINKGSSGEARMADFVNGGATRPGWYDSRTSITKIVIEEGVVNIGAYAFDGCSNLTEIDFGTIDTIGNHAFHDCTSLKSVSLPSTFNWMYSAVFDGCTALESAYLGERWWTEGTVPDYFFNNCTSLRVIRMGSKFTGFNTGALNNCTSLKVIITDNTDISVDGVIRAPTSVLGGTCSENTYSSTNLTYSYDMFNFALSFTGSGDMVDNPPWGAISSIIDTVSFAGTDAKTSVSTTAFKAYANLKSVNFTNVYAIGWGAFSDNPKLGSVQFDDELVEIWDWAFSGCTAIETIQFGNGSDDLHIRNHAFNNCTATTYWLNLPANTKYVDEYAFWCTNFNYIHIYNANIVFGDEAFGDGNGGYARFFGPDGTHTSIYDYVQQYKKNKAYNWHYYCDSTHYYATTTVAPTCTEQGYERYGCIYCEDSEYKSDFVDALGHDYNYKGWEDNCYTYECTRCGGKDFQLSAFEPMHYFRKALSTTDIDNAYNQPNYDGRVDVNADGFINGRDWAIITSNISKIDTTGKATVLDMNSRFQTIEGWGASGAWWSPEVGTWENTDDIVSLLYSKKNGIGLNIYRYNLGAGSLNDSSLYSVGTRTDCFLKSDGTYDWTADAGAMNTLASVNKFCLNVKVELFSNSAPVSLTKNGRAYGSPTAEGEDAQCNLDSSNFAAFADYVVKSAEHFLDEDYNVTEVSPINEPEWGWTGWYNGDGSISAGQEGCHFEPSEARDFYNNAMIPALQNSEKLNGKVELAVWECAQLNHGWWWSNDYNGGFLNTNFSSKRSKDWLGRSKDDDWQAWNSNIRSYVNTLDTHSYWVSAADRNAVMSQIDNDYYRTIQKIKCSEYCQMYNDGNSGVVGHTQAAGGSTNGMGIDYGLAMADIIYQDMTILNAVEWDWWTACGKGIYTDSLVYVDANDHDNIQTSKRLWCLGNYSRFIQEGAQRIKVTTGSQFGANLYTKPENIYTWKDGDNTGTDKNNYLDVSAYLNPDNSIAIVYVNNSDTIEYTSVNTTGYSNFKTYVTDETKDLELYQEGEITDAVCIPARSCTTVVLDNNNAKYLFAYFTGNSQKEQRIHFATSNGGKAFRALANGGEVIKQAKGTLNCRDPYIFKGHDDYYYIIATDMDASGNVWWGNSTSMVIWRSKDLVNWTDETIIDMATLTNTWIGRCWAPQVIWDDNEQKYLVYLSLYTSGDDNGTVIYYSYTDDLLDQSHYSQPHVLFDPNTGKDAIDGDITEFNGTYYMFYKDEDAATICVTSASSLTGEYSTTDILTLNTSFNDGKAEGLEGCQVYKEADGNYIFIADRYGANGVFAAFNLGTDLAASINLIKNGKSVMDYYDSALTSQLSKLGPRHGSMISISDDEYETLKLNF